MPIKESIIKAKSFLFAIRIVNLCKYVQVEKKEYVLTKQLLRSGTAVGAMIREAEHSESRKDFVHKLAIAQIEINETIYWLELLKETSYLSEEEFQSIHENAVGIIRILTAIIKTSKQKPANDNNFSNN